MNQSAAVIGLGYVGLPLCMKMVKAGFIDLAVNINNRMPLYVVDRVMDLLNDGGKSLARVEHPLARHILISETLGTCVSPPL